MDNVEYLQSITSEDSNTRKEIPLELKAAAVPKEMVIGFEKLLTAFNIQKDILEKGKISYYVAESMFMSMESFTELTQIPHGINIYDVRSTTKEPSLINYKNFSEVSRSSLVDATSQMTESIYTINNKNITLLDYLNSESASDKLSSALSVLVQKYLGQIEDIEKFISGLKYNVKEDVNGKALLTYDEIIINNVDPSNILGDLSTRLFYAQYKFHQAIKQPKLLEFLQDILTITKPLSCTSESTGVTDSTAEEDLFKFNQPNTVKVMYFVKTFKTLLNNKGINFKELSDRIYGFNESIESLRVILKNYSKDTNYSATMEGIITDKVNQLYASISRNYAIYFDILQAYVRLYRNLTVSSDRENMFFTISTAIDQFHKDLFD